MGETQGWINSKMWLEPELKYHLQLTQRKKGGRESSYGKLTRKSTIKSIRFVIQI